MNAKERYELSKSKRRRNDILFAVSVCMIAALVTGLAVIVW